MSPTPPTPLGYPPPHWLVLSYNVTAEAELSTVIITTDVALHLGLFYSPFMPTLTDRQRKRRGQTYVRDKHWSFTPIGVMDQAEEGDTTTHTYYLPPWLAPGGVWLIFGHLYPTQFRCEVCGSTALVISVAFTRSLVSSFFCSAWYCPTCNYVFRYNAPHNLTTSKSTSPFFYAPLTSGGFSPLRFDSFNEELLYYVLYIEPFDS
jgi:hypothetical protein